MSKLVILLLMAWSMILPGCMAQSLYQKTESNSSIASEKLGRRLAVSGLLPVAEVLNYLQEEKLLQSFPGKAGDAQIAVMPGSKAEAVIAEVERVQGWLYDCESQRFVVAYATHPIDNPDTMGRLTHDEPADRSPRLSVAFRIRFVGFTGNLSTQQLGAGGSYLEFGASVPCGVNSTWSSQQERSYYTGIKNTQTGDNVQTDRSAVSSGVMYSGVGAYLPGMLSRLTGSLSISSFVGDGLDRNTIDIPVNYDGPRRQWVKLFELRQLDASAQITFRNLGLRSILGGTLAKLGFGAENVAVLVYVE